MPLISARIISLITPDAIIGFADAGEEQSVFCASVIQLQGDILGDDPANHTFEWEQTFGTPVTLINSGTLFPSFVNDGLSDFEFTLYVDRNTPFETSDTVFISRRPSTTIKTSFGGNRPEVFVDGYNWTSGSQTGSTGSALSFGGTFFVDALDVRVDTYPYNYPPDHTYSPIYKAEDLRRIKNNLNGKYWLMRDVDMSELNYPWDPLGTPQRPFSGELQGNGFSIQNLSITSTPVAVDGGDGFYDSVTMNNGFEGTNGQTTYTGTFGDTWTFDGNAQISNGQAFTGSTSAFFDGSGDRIYTANTPGLFGSGDWTVEFMCYPLTDTSNQYITNVYSGVNNRSWSISMGTNNAPRADVWSSSAGLIALTGPTNTLNENVWTHVVLMRKGTGIYIFTNGVLRDSDVGTIGASDTVYENGVTPTTDLYIGRRPGNITHFNGYIDNYRITHEARYPTTGFAPPTEFPDSILKPAGLFSYIGNGALIEEVGVTNANISGVNASLYKGVLAGSAQGPSTDDGGTVTIRNCYVEGTVDSASDNAGGLIGHTGTNVSSTFENTYSDVTVTGGGTNTGGWAGNFQTEGTYNDNFWDSTKTAAGVGTGGDTPIAGEVDSLTTAQLQVQSNYTNWDFDTVWQMPELKDNIGPAELQNNIFDRIRSGFGSSLRTSANPQGLIWGYYQQGSILNFIGATAKGIIVEDQNPTTLGWENPRFFPVGHISALMTPGRRHRAFAVVDKGQLFDPKQVSKTTQRQQEYTYLLPGTFVGKENKYVSAISKFGGIVVASEEGVQTNINITINNPKKSVFQTTDTVTVAYTGDGAVSPAIVLAFSRFEGALKAAPTDFPDDVATFAFVQTEQFGGQTAISVTRLSGATIG